MPSLPVIVAALAAALTSFSRVFDATRPGWGKLPAWLQTLAPTLLMASGAIVAGLAHVASATDLTVVIVGGLMLILPGLPSNRSAAPLQASKPVTGTPSVGDAQVANVIAVKSYTVPSPPPRSPSWPPAAALLLLCCFGLKSTACATLGSSFSWPDAVSCLPTPSDLLSKVEDTLLAGGDYEAALKQLALTDGAGAVECAVDKFAKSFAPSTPGQAAARARGRAFLDKTGTKVSQ